MTVAGVRALAVFEASKGLLVLIAGAGLLAMVHGDVQHTAEVLVHHMHLDPARHYPSIFIAAAGRVSDTRLWLLAAGAFVYAGVRLLEAYGLWHVRPWAEWLAIVSGGLYLPVEIFELFRKPTPVRWIVFATNLGIVLGMLYVRFRIPDAEMHPSEPHGDPHRR